MSLPVEVNEEALPVPAGYRLLIALPSQEEKIGSIIIPDKTRDREQTASIVGCVLKMGADAYLDQDKYPTGPWCQIGDWVVFRAYSGTRILIDGQEFRLINDDTVEGVVDDPRRIARAV